MYPEAVSEWQDITRLLENAPRAAAAGDAFQKGGWRGFLKAELDWIQKNPQANVPNYLVARLYSLLGQTNDAFAALEKAYAAREGSIVYLKSDPVMDPLRSDPRFQDLLRRVNLQL